jgi:uncharacterized protein
LSSDITPSGGPYHEGELAVQTRAGAAEMAQRIGRSIRADVSPLAAAFLAEQRFAVLGWPDGDGGRGRVWASPVFGAPGFLSATPDGVVSVRAQVAAGDPLRARTRPPDQVGLVAIDFAARRRLRVNGTARGDRPERFDIQPRQVYANCPKYIQARDLLPAAATTGPSATSSSLRPAQAALIAAADTFFIASHHAEGGADASHRGGEPGFVKVSRRGDALSWPDYPGNTMFQTLGNISVDGRAGLLFIDFDSGTTLQLAGAARIAWRDERHVEFDIEQAIEIPAALPLRWS